MLAEAYAPDVDVLGVAAQAPASDLPRLIEGAQGSVFGKIVSSYVIHAYADAYDDVRVEDYVDGYRAAVLRDVAGRCAVDSRALFSIAELSLLPGEIFEVNTEGTPLGARLDENVPLGPFPMPVFISQGIDDDIVLEPVQAGFVERLCTEGTNLVYRRYEGRNHVSLVAPDSALTADLVDWTRARFAGEVSEPDCTG